MPLVTVSFIVVAVVLLVPLFALLSALIAEPFLPVILPLAVNVPAAVTLPLLATVNTFSPLVFLNDISLAFTAKFLLLKVNAPAVPSLFLAVMLIAPVLPLTVTLELPDFKAALVVPRLSCDANLLSAP